MSILDQILQVSRPPNIYAPTPQLATATSNPLPSDVTHRMPFDQFAYALGSTGGQYGLKPSQAYTLAYGGENSAYNPFFDYTTLVHPELSGRITQDDPGYRQWVVSQLLGGKTPEDFIKSLNQGVGLGSTLTGNDRGGYWYDPATKQVGFNTFDNDMGDLAGLGLLLAPALPMVLGAAGAAGAAGATGAFDMGGMGSATDLFTSGAGSGSLIGGAGADTLADLTGGATNASDVVYGVAGNPTSTELASGIPDLAGGGGFSLGGVDNSNLFPGGQVDANNVVYGVDGQPNAGGGLGGLTMDASGNLISTSAMGNGTMSESFLDPWDLMPDSDITEKLTNITTDSSPFLSNGTSLLDVLKNGGSGLKSLLGGDGGDMSLLKLLGTLGATGLGALGSYNQTQMLKDIADRYYNLGAPSRGRFEASFAPGFSMANEPGYAGALQATSDAVLRSLSAKGGNPYGNPAALEQANKYILNATALPALYQYRNQNASTGGYGAYNTAAPGAATGAATSEGNIYSALGYGLNNVLNPQPTIVDLAKAMKGLV